MKKFIKVTSLEHALELNGETIDEFNHRTQFDTDGQKAAKELETIAFAMNGGKHMKLGEIRYWPAFLGSSGSGFRFYVCFCDLDFSFVGSRLTVVSREAAEYFGEKHLSIWQRYTEGI